MKSFKIFLIVLTFVNLYFASGLLKNFGFINFNFIDDSIWILISPILLLVIFFLSILEVIYNKDSMLKNIDLKLRVILFINILVLCTLTLFALSILNSYTDGGLFS